jgi:hypothetical protein
MRFRRIVVVLAALLALAFGSATAIPSAGVFSTKTACVCACVVSDRDQAPVGPGRIEADEVRTGNPVLPVCLRAAWADAAVRFQLPPPADAPARA